MKSTIANYWWGSSADSKHMHWMKWKQLTDRKIQGGMGFRDLPLFNRVMLGKQAWRLIDRPVSLCARVLKGRYFHDTNFLSATRKNMRAKLGVLSLPVEMFYSEDSSRDWTTVRQQKS
jgi:hypothetical protein